eukprot:1156931-Pelagomonas_calceolata.AAC.16
MRPALAWIDKHSFAWHSMGVHVWYFRSEIFCSAQKEKEKEWKVYASQIGTVGHANALNGCVHYVAAKVNRQGLRRGCACFKAHCWGLRYADQSTHRVVSKLVMLWPPSKVVDVAHALSDVAVQHAQVGPLPLVRQQLHHLKLHARVRTGSTS